MRHGRPQLHPQRQRTCTASFKTHVAPGGLQLRYMGGEDELALLYNETLGPHCAYLQVQPSPGKVAGNSCCYLFQAIGLQNRPPKLGRDGDGLAT
jgi:hypothetical protein